MNDFAIRVEGLGKQYRIGGRPEKYKTVRESLVSAASAPVKRVRNAIRGRALDSSSETFWALQDLSFEIQQGDAVGIIGHNGAGKSTLLKILSRITEPTTGYAMIKGRVGALLEVGTGFHPELTGRENIYLNAAILGMTRREIDRKFDEIVAFAEIEQFIDTPVKRYSSGMGLRLGFAIAAHLEPEVLVVDEVLAVGDMNFQKKCLGKLDEVAHGGRTVLFVSHNMVAVESLCQRVIWMNKGQIKAEGSPNEIIAEYMQHSISMNGEQLWSTPEEAPGNEQVRIRRVAVRPESNNALDPITMSTPIVLEFDYWNLQPDRYLNLSVYVKNEQGIIAFNTASIHDPNWHGKPFKQGLYRSMCSIPGNLLNSGIYSVDLLVVRDEARVIYQLPAVLSFDVEDAIEARGNSAWHGRYPGTVHPRLNWETTLMTDNLASSIEISTPLSVRGMDE